MVRQAKQMVAIVLGQLPCTPTRDIHHDDTTSIS